MTPDDKMLYAIALQVAIVTIPAVVLIAAMKFVDWKGRLVIVALVTAHFYAAINYSKTVLPKSLQYTMHSKVENRPTTVYYAIFDNDKTGTE